jgi:ketosteroid isomerase-like protein
MDATPLELVRDGFEAASRGDVDSISALLSPDVHWHGAGDDVGGCRNREQALRWMRDAIDRGVRVELLDARELPGDRVLLLLQRQSPPGEELPPPHGQIVTLRDGLIADMAVYPAADEAVAAAGVS